MAVLVTLTGRFVNPDETGALAGGRITFQLVPADVPDKVLNETVIPGPVSVPIVGGNFTVTLRATDDPDLLANVTGELVYKVTRTGTPGSWLIALPEPGPWDWTDLAPQPDSDTVVIPGPPGTPGPAGPAGPPGETTVVVFTYTDETVARPAASVVFWRPDPYNLGDPFGALPGDCVLRSTPDVISGPTGITQIWHGLAADYEALTPDAGTVYYILAEPEP